MIKIKLRVKLYLWSNLFIAEVLERKLSEYVTLKYENQNKKACIDYYNQLIQFRELSYLF